MFKYSLEILPSLISGARLTLSLFLMTLVGSIPLGLLVGLGLVTKSNSWPIRLLRSILRAYVWLMRGTPLLLQLIFVFYGLPIIHIVFERYDAAIFAFILNYTAYFAEIFRGGLQGIDPGQYEASRVLGLNELQTVQKVIIPQVIKSVIPAIGNEVINLVKDSSLVYVIGLGDLLRAGNVASARDVTLVPLVLVAIVYLLLTAFLTWGLRRLERHYAYYR